MSLRRMLAVMEHSPDLTETWFVHGGTSGSALGWYWLTLPGLENVDRAYLRMAVDPDFRRQGIGTELLRHASRRAALHRRTALVADLLRGTGTAAFALRAGATPGVVAQRRVLHLDKAPADKIADLSETARRAAPGYSLRPWQGRTPDAYLDGAASLYAALGDGPRYEEGTEWPRWDARRVRERVDGKSAAFGTLAFSVAAFHNATGEMAALTQLEVDPETPEWAEQQMTAVAAPHRGHQLGLQVKAVMAWWLKQTEPRLRHIVAWSAETNRHMTAIDRTLGYDPFEPSSQTYELTVEPAAISSELKL